MKSVFLQVLDMSISAAAVIAVVALLRLVLGNAPKKWRYLLWVAPAFRLACPVSFRAFFSIFRLGPAAASALGSSGGTGELQYIPRAAAPIAPVIRQTVNASGVPIPSTPGAISVQAAAASADPMQVLLTAGMILWLAGLAVMLILGVVRYLRMKGLLADAAKLEEGVYVSDAVYAPFILGLLPPRIFIPAGLEGRELGYVLCHERAHLRRFDHWVKLLGYLLLSLHWFNPLVWLGFHLMSRDMEMSCDERVLAALGGEAKEYSRTLLSFAAGRRFPAPAPLGFGESDVASRIKNALRWHRPKLWVTILAVILCLATIAACTANPKEKTEETPAPIPTEATAKTPWEWSSTLKASDVREAVLLNAADRQAYGLNTAQRNELVSMLNALPQDQVVQGRGIPSEKLLELRDTGYALRFAGGVIELDTPDPGTEETPGVWEIHDDALYEWLEARWEEASLSWAMEADPSPAAEPDGLSKMAVLTAGDITGILSAGWGNTDAETLAPLMNAASAHSAAGPADRAANHPEWSVEVYLEAGPYGWSSMNEHYELCAQQKENLLYVRYWDGKHPDGGAEEFWLEDADLYSLVRSCYRSDGVIEKEAWKKYGARLEARAREVMDAYEPYGACGMVGFDIIRLEKTAHIWRAEDGEYLPVYAWNTAFYPEDVNRVGWVGGMKLDADNRVVGLEMDTFFAARDSAAGPELTFLGWDEFLGRPEAAYPAWKEAYQKLLDEVILPETAYTDWTGPVQFLGLADLNDDGVPELICYLPGGGKSSAAAIVTFEEGEARAFNAECAFGLPLAKNAMEYCFCANLQIIDARTPAFRYDEAQGFWVLNSANGSNRDAWCTFFRFGADSCGYLAWETMMSVDLVLDDQERETGWRINGEEVTQEDYYAAADEYDRWLESMEMIETNRRVYGISLREKTDDLAERVGAWLESAAP